MKILLDESLPVNTKKDFEPEHQVKTVRDMGWLGKKNGELLRLAGSSGFDCFVTVDKNLRHQQRLENISFTIFLLIAINNRRETLQALIEKVKDKIQQTPLPGIIEIS